MSRWASKSRKALEVHRRFSRIAKKELPPLAAELRHIGPVWFPPVAEKDLARYLCRVIVGQQLSVPAARTIWGRVEERIENPHGRVPYCLNGRSARRLRACGLSRAKANALLEIGKAAEGDALNAKRLGRLSHERRAEELRRIWGVGAWTADMVSMFYFREEDVWPGGDLSVRNALYDLFPRKPRSEKTVLELIDKFSPHRSILALYLWSSLDAAPQ